METVLETPGRCSVRWVTFLGVGGVRIFFTTNWMVIVYFYVILAQAWKTINMPYVLKFCFWFVQSIPCAVATVSKAPWALPGFFSSHRSSRWHWKHLGLGRPDKGLQGHLWFLNVYHFPHGLSYHLVCLFQACLDELSF